MSPPIRLQNISSSNEICLVSLAICLATKVCSLTTIFFNQYHTCLMNTRKCLSRFLHLKQIHIKTRYGCIFIPKNLYCIVRLPMFYLSDTFYLSDMFYLSSVLPERSSVELSCRRYPEQRRLHPCPAVSRYVLDDCGMQTNAVLSFPSR